MPPHVATVMLGNHKTPLHQSGNEVANWRVAIVNTKDASMIPWGDMVCDIESGTSQPKSFLCVRCTSLRRSTLAKGNSITGMTSYYDDSMPCWGDW